jgi:hypothetical protein
MVGVVDDFREWLRLNGDCGEAEVDEEAVAVAVSRLKG